MPSVLSRVSELKRKFLKNAPKQSQEKIEKVLEIYQDRANISFPVVQNMVLALYSPSLIGRPKVEKMYENFLSKYQNEETHPEDYTRGMRYSEKLQERRDRLLGVRKTYQINVSLFTQTRKLDKPPEQTPVPKKVKKRKFKGLHQYWNGTLTVQAYSSRIFEELKWKLTTRGTKEFKRIYPICVTDVNFMDREKKVPGYLDAIYLLDWTVAGDGKRKAPEDPIQTKKRSGDKVAIAFKYCSYQLDLSKKTFREALYKDNRKSSECWINTIFDNFSKLLRPDKTKNLITRETILKVLGRTEEDIKEGLTIEEVLPFFQKYKLKLRVYDVFYNLIYKYDPETPNFNNPALYCVTDGDHIYTLNKDIDALAQKSSSDEYQLTAYPNFYIPEKKAENPKYRIIERIDEILETLREQSDDEEKTVYMIHKTDNLESIVWQLYDAGYRPNLKYGVGKLSWVSLLVNKTSFVFRSQQLIDWAIDGALQVSDAEVFNRMHDAKTEFH